MELSKKLALFSISDDYFCLEEFEDLFCSNLGNQLKALRKVRRFLSSDLESRIQMIENLNIIPRITNLLLTHNTYFQYEILWIITNMCSAFFIPKSCISALDSLLILCSKTSCEQIVHQGLWCLANIAGDCEELRILLLNKDIIQVIHFAVKNHDFFNENLSRVLSWFLSNLMRSKSPNLFQFLGILTILVKSNDLETKADAFWATCRLLSQNFDFLEPCSLIPIVKEAEITLNTESEAIIPCLRTLANIATGNHLEILIELIPILVKFKTQDSLLALSNLSTGTQMIRFKLMQHNILGLWMEMLQHSQLGREASWGLSNISSSCELYIAMEIANTNFCQFLCHSDTVVQEKIMETIMNLSLCFEVMQVNWPTDVLKGEWNTYPLNEQQKQQLQKFN